MEIQLSLRRLPAEITVVQRLDRERARALVRSVRAAQTYRRLLLHVLRSPEKPILLDGVPYKVRLLRPRSDLEEGIRAPTGPRRRPGDRTLWVFVRWTKGQGEGNEPLPDLAEIAQLRDSGLTRWARFLRKHGLVAFDREWVVAYLPERQEYLLRLSLEVLDEIAHKAAVLAAAEKAIYGDPEEFQHLPFFPQVQFFFQHLKRLHLQPSHTPSRPSWKVNQDPAQEGRRLIGLAIEEALWQFEAAVDVEESDRGLAFKQTLHARGCWPLAVLSEFLPQVGYVRRSFKRCQAHSCKNEVHAPFRKYCSKQCYERQKQRNKRERREGRAPIAASRVYRRLDEGPRNSS